MHALTAGGSVIKRPPPISNLYSYNMSYTIAVQPNFRSYIVVPWTPCPSLLLQIVIFLNRQVGVSDIFSQYKRLCNCCSHAVSSCTALSKLICAILLVFAPNYTLLKFLSLQQWYHDTHKSSFRGHSHSFPNCSVQTITWSCSSSIERVCSHLPIMIPTSLQKTHY